MQFKTLASAMLGMVLAFGASIGLIQAQAQAQTPTFPNKPVRILSPFPAGSGPDAVARIVGERLTSVWKQGVVVEARPGANGFLAINAAKAAAPTGYDLLLADVGHLAVSPSLFDKLPYDPVADFVPVGLVYRTSFFVVVGINSPFKTVKDLLAAAAANPGKVTYASNSVGGPLHLGAAQLDAAAGTQMLHVPYKEISQLYAAVSTGEVDWAMGSIASAGPLLRANKLRFLAIADSARSTALPDIPMLDEAGGPKGVEARTWVALMAPKGTPPATVDLLNKALNDALAQPDVKEKFAGFGFVPAPSRPADLAHLIASDTKVYEALVKRTGAKASQ